MDAMDRRQLMAKESLHHLFIGTHKDNTQDALKKGRMEKPSWTSEQLIKAWEEREHKLSKYYGDFYDINEPYYCHRVSND